MITTKTLAIESTELKFDTDRGSFKGYASVWGGVDSYRDTILKGAFIDTLKEHGMPKMFFMHNHSMPVGKYTLADEDSKGLWVEGELTPNHSVASDVRAALMHETLDGLSIGGTLRRGDYKDGNEGGRIIHKWTKLLEVSPVVYPADSAARIDFASVKADDLSAEIDQLKSIRDFEHFLRDATGFSRSASLALTVRAREIFGARGSDEPIASSKGDGEILRRLQKLIGMTS